MKRLLSLLLFLLAVNLPPAYAATLLPQGESCFQATTGITGMVGALGTIVPGVGGTNNTYGGVPLVGGSGTGATANITVTAGGVASVAILNPGTAYVVSDVLSAAPSNIGNVTGFSVPINSVSINSSLAGGTVGFYVPNTQTFSQTWQNSAQTILNNNPVNLDQNGCAIIYGEGVYRQILKDSLGNTVWDQLTASTDQSGFFWAGLAGGTPNAITLTDNGFSQIDGQGIQFRANATNTGPVTLTVSPNGIAIPIVKDTSAGPVPLTGGEIAIGSGGQNNVVSVVYDAANAEFHLISVPLATQSSTTSCNTPVNAGLTASVAANALTINLVTASGATPSSGSPVTACFRSATTTTGTPVFAAVSSALSITVPNAGTLGTTAAVPARIWVFLANNGGAPELVVATCSNTTTIFPCKSWDAVPTTTTSVSAGSPPAANAGVPYAVTGVTNDALTVVGYIETTEAVAGAWVTAPTAVRVVTYGVPLPGDTVQVAYTLTSVQTGGTGAFISTGMSTNLTPSSSVNLVRVRATAQFQGLVSGVSTRFSRGSTPTLFGPTPLVSISSSGAGINVSSFAIDAPGTTSSLTYFLYFNAPGTVQFNGTSSPSSSSMEAEEIMGFLENVINDNVALRKAG
jgi:hypothetical protein